MRKIKRSFKQPPMIPAYLEPYHWAYRSRISPYLDSPFLVNLLLLNQYRRLKEMYICEFSSEDSVLQIGSVYHDLCPSLASKVRSLTIIEVLKDQVNILESKLSNSNTRVVWGDGTDELSIQMCVEDDNIENIGSFMLLHEIPQKERINIVQNMLSQARKKVVFLDYHKMDRWGLLQLGWFRTMEPFAEEFIQGEIWQGVSQNVVEQFIWRKEIVFGELYQKVVAERIQH